MSIIYNDLSNIIVSLQTLLSNTLHILYGRIHNVRPSSKKFGFVILRDRIYTIQCTASKSVLNEKFADLMTLPTETVVQLHGTIKMLPCTVPRVESCYYHDFEFSISDFTVVSMPVATLPFSLDDANCAYTTESDRSSVTLHTRLNNRYFELRAPFYYALFQLQNAIVNGFRNFSMDNNFTEIHSPKLLGTSSETGSSVFKVGYFDKVAYLAQSPQLYKQMMINADHIGVFEVGPVFRAENSVSNSHLCEFTGVDFEMQLPMPYNYNDLIRFLWNALVNAFAHMEKSKNVMCEYVRTHHPHTVPIIPSDPIILTFGHGVQLLQDAGYAQNALEDLTTENEKALGKIVKNIYGSDLFVLSEYPSSVRPFYTKILDDKPDYSCSYDFIFRGREICSGAQRVHDVNELEKRITSIGSSLEPFKDYLDSFRYGSKPHGGGGFGLERLLMLYFDLPNVRVTSLFPRDPSRLTP
jgi:aspartyl-tRNA synthetase